MAKGLEATEQSVLKRSLSHESQRNISVQCSLGPAQEFQTTALSSGLRTTKEKWYPSVPPARKQPTGRTTRNGYRSVSPRVTLDNLLTPMKKQLNVHTLLQTQRRSPLASLQSSGDDSRLYSKKPTHYFRFTARREPASPTVARTPLGPLQGKRETRLPPLKRIARKGRSLAGVRGVAAYYSTAVGNMERRDSGVKMYLRAFAVFGLSEIATTTLLAPLERYKLLRQTQPLNRDAAIYPNFLSYATTCAKHEGFTAYWRGNVLSLYRIGISSLVRFRLHYFYMSILFSGKGDESNPVIRSILQETAIGLTALLFVYPFDQIRTRFAADVVPRGKDRSYYSIVECLNKTTRSDGLGGNYQGIGITALSLPAYIAFSIALEKELKAASPNEAESAHALALAASLQMVFYPVDTIRRRLQVNGARGKMKVYAGTIDCIKKTLQTEGVAGFYSGLSVHLIRLAPAFYLFHTLTHLG